MAFNEQGFRQAAKQKYPNLTDQQLDSFLQSKGVTSQQPQQGLLGRATEAITGVGKGIYQLGKGIEDVTGITKSAEEAKRLGAGTGSPLKAAGAFGQAALNIGSLALSPEGKLATAGLGAAFGLTRGLAESQKPSEVLKSTATDALLFSAIPVASQLLEKGAKTVLPKLSQWLEKINLRLTPTQKSTLGKKLNDVTKFLSEKQIIGTPEQRFDKATQLYQATEQELQVFLESVADKTSVGQKALISDLQRLKSSLMKDNVDAVTVGKQIDSHISNIRTQYTSGKIPVNRLNNLKRSTYDNAYNKAGDKVLDDVEHDVADVYRKHIEQSTQGFALTGNKTVGEFNKEYGKLIQGRKLLRTAMGRNQLGVFGRGMITWLGYETARSLGLGAIESGVVGGLTEHFGKEAATPIRSAIGVLATKTAGESPTLIKGARRVTPALINRAQSNPEEQ